MGQHRTQPARGAQTGTQRPIRRWDPAPLVDLDGGTLRETARRLRIDPALLCRPLTDKQADAYATRLGVHPVQVWGTAWWNP